MAPALWLLNKCHVSYGGLHWICGGVAFMGTALLVLQAHFSRPLKLLLPFTYFHGLPIRRYSATLCIVSPAHICRGSQLGP
jgi:hypothetical protein